MRQSRRPVLLLDVLAQKADWGCSVQLRYNYRLYPTPGQQAALARAFGCARVAYSDALGAREDAHAAGKPDLSDAEMSRRLTAAKASPGRAGEAGTLRAAA